MLLLSLPLAYWSTVAAGTGEVQGVYADWLVRNLQSLVSPWEVLLSATGLYTRLNGPMWSLRVELLWSAVFPLLFAAVRSRRTRWIAVGALAVLALAPLRHQFGLSFGLSFALGALIPFMRARGVHGIFTAVAVLVMAYDRACLSPWDLDERLLDCIETSASFVIVLDLYGSAWRHRLLAHPALVRVGEWSFGIYLLHLPIMLLQFSLLQKIYGDGLVLGAPGLAPFFLGLSTAFITLCVSAICHRYYEIPFQGFGRQLSRRITGSLGTPTNSVPLPPLGSDKA